jgi:hypothetical protein
MAEHAGASSAAAAEAALVSATTARASEATDGGRGVEAKERVRALEGWWRRWGGAFVDLSCSGDTNAGRYSGRAGGDGGCPSVQSRLGLARLLPPPHPRQLEQLGNAWLYLQHLLAPIEREPDFQPLFFKRDLCRYRAARAAVGARAAAAAAEAGGARPAARHGRRALRVGVGRAVYSCTGCMQLPHSA